MKPVLTDDGAAIQIQDGWPLVETEDGQRVPWDIAKQAKALAEANGEAGTRRKVLENAARALGLEVDVRTAKGIEALEAKLGEYSPLMEELGTLRKARDAGQLGEDAESKIKAAAEKLRTEEFGILTAKLTKAEKDRSEAQQQAARDASKLRDAEVRRGLIAFHQRHEAFDDGTLQGFLLVATQPTSDGYRWVPTGKHDEETGEPLLALANEDGQVHKGPDGIEPMTLKQFTESRLTKSHRYLFRQPKGTGDWDPNTNGSGVELHKLTTSQLAEMARRSAGIR